VDGFDFSKSAPEDFGRFKDFAQKAGVEIWFSASLKERKPLFNEKGYPTELVNFIEKIDVLLTLKYKDRFIRLDVVKNRKYPTIGKPPLCLDPATFLMA
jgi:hypothetical protein